MKRYGFPLLILVLGCLLLSGCSFVKKNPECTVTIREDEKFGAAELDISQEDFFALGFQLGDSVNLVFSNGYMLASVPFYNGYYVETGAPVVVAYPGSENISITLNSVGIWETGRFSVGDTVTVSLDTAKEYLTTQEALGQSYSTDIEKYDSSVAFANFRSLSGGKLKENLLYRGASPVNNARGRAQTVDTLLKEYNIGFILDLADSADNMESFAGEEGFASEYTYGLYRDGKVALLGMGSAYASEKYQQKVAEGLRMMMDTEGSWDAVYIHCLEGKDRTGFVCMLIEALCGASYDEMLSDYMITYENYYQISLEATPEKYNAIAELYFNAFMEYLHDTDDIAVLKSADYRAYARNYLLTAGMTDEEINRLYTVLTGEAA